MDGFKQVSGTAQVTDSTADAEVIGAQGAGIITHVCKGLVMVTVAAAGGGGEVALEDGAGNTRFVEVDADAVGVHVIDFGEYGYPLTANRAVNLTTDNAVTTQATARATLTGWATV